MTHVQRFGLAAMVAAMAALGQASAYAQAPAEGDSGGETAFIRDPGVQAAFDAGVKMLGRNNPAVLVRKDGTVQGILTRSDLLQFLMAR